MSAINTFRHANTCAIAAYRTPSLPCSAITSFARTEQAPSHQPSRWSPARRRVHPKASAAATPAGTLPITIYPHSLIASRTPAARTPYPIDRPTPTSASPRPGRASRFPGRALLGAGAGIGQGSPAVLQVCPDKPLELFEPAGVCNEHVLRHEVEFSVRSMRARMSSMTPL
jgi:hypothetical protein